MELLALFARQATLAVETSHVFSNLARALFQAVALTSPDKPLWSALEQRAAAVPRAQAELTELARLFYDLGVLGPNERFVAARITEDFLAYARKRRR
jgi:hypothetical protein